MDARIESKGPIFLAGMSFYGDPFGKASAWDEENEIGSLWKRFMSFVSASPEAIGERADRSEFWFELHATDPDSERTGRYEIFTGVQLRSLGAIASLSPRISIKSLPPADYAVITVKGEEINGDWMSRLYADIIPGLGRKADKSFFFELYDSRFKGMDRLAESELDFYFPLLEKAKG